MIKALPEGRTYTLALYIATLLFVLALAVLIFGATHDQIGASIGTMTAFAGSLGVVAGAYGAKATAQHYKGTVKAKDAVGAIQSDNERAEDEGDEPR